jgi:diguanylate cyclase (GGDEF)-like protein
VRFGKRPAVLAALFAVYFLSGKLGLSLAFVNASTSAISPQAGLALAALLLLGYQVWPAILFGSILVNISAAWSLPVAIGVGVGRTLEALLSAYLVNTFAGGRRAFQNAQDIIKFGGLAVLASTTVSATTGVISLGLGGFASWADYGSIWVTWWLSNLSGTLLVAPLIILWSSGPWVRWKLRKVYEALALVVVLALTGLVVFGGWLPEEVKGYPLEFICVPILLWAAFRFGRREAAASAVILSGIAIWGTLQGYGPFVRATRNESILLLQAFMSVTAVLTVALAALVSEYALAEAQLRELAVTDALTGLPNYRKLLDVLRTEIVRSDRADRPFAVLFIDMDGLKRINDEHGHLAGSRAVCRLADTLRRSCRKTDTPARFGGDEFVVVLPETEETGARLVAQRVSDRLAADGDRPLLSISAGVAVYPRDGGTPATLLSLADRALYEAKANKPDRRANAVPTHEWSHGVTH